MPRGTVADMRTAPAVSLVLGAAGLLVGATLFFSDGSRDARVFPLGTVAVLFAAGLVAATLVGALPRPALGRAGGIFFALFGGFVLWSGLSVQWSIAGDASWAYFNRDLVYLAFAVVGTCAAAVATRRAIAGTIAGLLGLVIGWALLGKVVPPLVADGERQARLREPIGYWNGLALLCAVALVLGLWLASSRGFRPVVRAAGALLVYGASVAVVLTYSRAGIAVAALAALAWVLLGRAAFDSIATLVFAGSAALGVAAFGISLPGVADDNLSNAARAHDGRLFGVVLVAVAAGVFGIALAAAGRAAPSRRLERRVVRLVAVATGVVVVALAVAVTVRGGGPKTWIESQWDQFRSSDPAAVSNEAGRFHTLNSNNRWVWWQEAWRGFRDEPLTGQGAGTFFLWHRIERDRDVNVNQPHNVPLQFLSDTGMIGFLLAMGAFAAAFAAAVGSVRTVEGAERGAALALSLAAGAFFVHSLVDIDWEYLAVTAPVFFMLGAAIPPSTASAVRRPSWALAAAAVGLVTVSSLLAPWLANRRLDGAYEAYGQGSYAAAAADAEDAHGLNPLGAEPLLVWGLAAEAGGRLDEANRRYRQAVELQPKNPDAWFYLGAFELDGLDQPRRALADLTTSYELDPYGSPELDNLLRRARAETRATSSRR
jgi:O-Antigen ligase/TPR repeat